MTGAGYAQRDATYSADILSTADSAASCTDHPARDGSSEAGTSASCSPSLSQRSFASTQATTEFLESFRLLAAGGVAGAVSKTATAPLARLTILYQVFSASMLASIDVTQDNPCKLSSDQSVSMHDAQQQDA